MGANDFEQYQEGTDLPTAFHAAVYEARVEHGNGYTGSIAEKSEYVVLRKDPLPLADARALVPKLLSDHPNVQDKYGPAGAIAVRGAARTWRRLPIPATPGGYRSIEDAAAAAVTGLLDAGETVTGVTGMYEPGRGGRVLSGHVNVTTTGADGHTGWLLIGYAAS